MSSGQTLSRRLLWRQARPVCCLLYVIIIFFVLVSGEPRFSFVFFSLSFFFPGVPVGRGVGGVKGASGCSKGKGVAALP